MMRALDCMCHSLFLHLDLPYDIGFTTLQCCHITFPNVLNQYFKNSHLLIEIFKEKNIDFLFSHHILLLNIYISVSLSMITLTGANLRSRATSYSSIHFISDANEALFGKSWVCI